MTLAELRAFVREQAQDNLEPYFLSDAALNGHLNEAEEEACIRAKLLYDASKAVTLVADQAVYPLDEAALSARFFLFDRFALSGNNYRVLHATTLHSMDCEHPGWEDAASGIPEYVLMDQAPNSVTLWPTPSAVVSGDVVRLRGFRLPLAAMSADGDEPEVDAAYHRYLADWALHRFFSVSDADMFDLGRAGRHLAAFESRFGVRPSAELQSLMARRETFSVKPRMKFTLFGV